MKKKRLLWLVILCQGGYDMSLLSLLLLFAIDGLSNMTILYTYIFSVLELDITWDDIIMNKHLFVDT